MAHTTRISLNLSAKSVKQVQKQLLQYQKDFQDNLGLFVSKLLIKGYDVAMRNKGPYSAYIAIMHHTDDPSPDGTVIGVLTAYNIQACIREWVTETGIQQAEISPIAMAEFGSGWKALNPLSKTTGIGQGSFPGQVHAFDPGGWSYMTTDGMWHRSTGEEPTMPMLKARRRMERDIAKTRKEVWGG